MTNYPIDAVFTWVDGNDEKHAQKIKKHIPKGEYVHFHSRYIQLDEIEYAVRSILKYAPFVRQIFVVTDNQIPKFLDRDKHGFYNKVKVVDHSDIFGEDISSLPVFNSRSIETKLYNIPGLAEHFIYFNDDVFLMRETVVEDFFIDGEPVLRGGWTRFTENIFYKKWSLKKRRKGKAHKLAQELSAKIVGFDKLFKYSHTPFPMRQSILRNYFSENRSVEQRNVSFKFRNIEQFLCVGLANHLEIRNKSCHLTSDFSLVNFSFNSPLWWMKWKLNNWANRGNKLFLNLQDIHLFPKEKQEYLMDWLKEKYRKL